MENLSPQELNNAINSINIECQAIKEGKSFKNEN